MFAAKRMIRMSRKYVYRAGSQSSFLYSGHGPCGVKVSHLECMWRLCEVDTMVAIQHSAQQLLDMSTPTESMGMDVMELSLLAVMEDDDGN